MEKEYYEPMASEYRGNREDEIVKPTRFFARGLLKIVGLENEQEYYIRDEKVTRKAFENFIDGTDLHSLIPISPIEQRLLDMKVLKYEANVICGDVDFTLPSKRAMEKRRITAMNNVLYDKHKRELEAKEAKAKEVEERRAVEYRETILAFKLDALEREHKKLLDEETAIRDEETKRNAHMAEHGWYEG